MQKANHVPLKTSRENGLINRADASKISGINILLIFWIDIELLPIKMAATPFATVSNGVAEFYLALFDGCSLSGFGASALGLVLWD